MLADFCGGELLAICIPTPVPLVFLLSLDFHFIHNNHRWNESLDIRFGEYQIITPEGGSLSCLGFPNALAREELVGTRKGRGVFVSE